MVLFVVLNQTVAVAKENYKINRARLTQESIEVLFAVEDHFIAAVGHSKDNVVIFKTKHQAILVHETTTRSTKDIVSVINVSKCPGEINLNAEIKDPISTNEVLRVPAYETFHEAKIPHTKTVFPALPPPSKAIISADEPF